MNPKEQALLIFVGALAIGALAQRIVRYEAAILGLSTMEVALIGMALPVAAKRLR